MYTHGCIQHRQCNEKKKFPCKGSHGSPHNEGNTPISWTTSQHSRCRTPRNTKNASFFIERRTYTFLFPRSDKKTMVRNAQIAGCTWEKRQKKKKRRSESDDSTPVHSSRNIGQRTWVSPLLWNALLLSLESVNEKTVVLFYPRSVPYVRGSIQRCTVWWDFKIKKKKTTQWNSDGLLSDNGKHMEGSWEKKKESTCPQKQPVEKTKNDTQPLLERGSRQTPEAASKRGTQEEKENKSWKWNSKASGI